MIIAGVATLPARRDFFRNKCLPSIKKGADVVRVYEDVSFSPDFESQDAWGELGDAGKFVAMEDAGHYATKHVPEEGFYYFSCDDDLEYSPEYFEFMIRQIERFNRQAVISLHGSSFRKFPIESYYKDKHGPHCLHPNKDTVKVLLPGTGVTAFHSSLFTQEERRNFLQFFPVPNMADIWMGLLLQRKRIPAIVPAHNGDLLTYNHTLPLEETVWGRYHQNDFIQTALVNQFSLSPGFRFPPLQPLTDQV